MAFTYKVLGQVAPLASTDTDVYTVPAATQAVVSTIAVCNTANTSQTFSIAIRPAGALLETKHYIAKDVLIASNDTAFITIGASLSATDVVTVNSNAATTTFNVFGSEIS